MIFLWHALDVSQRRNDWQFAEVRHRVAAGTLRRKCQHKPEAIDPERFRLLLGSD